jgi:DNA-binding NarL/FixJ family response regulator
VSTTIRQVVEAVRRHRPHVLVLDLRMPGRDTLQVMREVHAAFPETRTIVYTGLEQEDEMERARHAGAWAYIPKRDDLTVLFEAIRQVAAGRRFFPEF